MASHWVLFSFVSARCRCCLGCVQVGWNADPVANGRIGGWRLQITFVANPGDFVAPVTAPRSIAFPPGASPIREHSFLHAPNPCRVHAVNDVCFVTTHSCPAGSMNRDLLVGTDGGLTPAMSFVTVSPSVDGATQLGGDFVVSLFGEKSASIAYAASDVTMQARINSLWNAEAATVSRMYAAQPFSLLLCLCALPTQ